MFLWKTFWGYQNGYALPLTKYEEWRKSIEKGKQDDDDYLEEIDEDNDDVVNHYL